MLVFPKFSALEFSIMWLDVHLIAVLGDPICVLCSCYDVYEAGFFLYSLGELRVYIYCSVSNIGVGVSMYVSFICNRPLLMLLHSVTF
jgi:hypothetical protein